MRRWIAVVMMAALALAGCATLPMDGDVQQSETRMPQDPRTEVLARGPVEDSSPEEIVSGFLLASSFGTDQFNAARSFLTPGATETWSPTESVYLYTSDRDPETHVEADGSITVSVDPVARIDAYGNYIPLVDETHTLSFSLVVGADEQWRIAALDDGVMISDQTFLQVYVPAPLHFVSADEGALVPDLRWFPQTTAPQLIVENLLAGPSGWLQDSVTSAFPSDVSIGPDGVYVEEGVVTIDLTSEASEISESDGELMLAQLQQSFAALTDISVVEVTVEGEDSLGIDSVRTFPFPQSVSTPYMLQDGALVRWDGAEMEIVNDSAEFLQLDARYPTVPYSESSAPIVVVSDGNELRTVPTDAAASRILYEGQNLVPPSYDRYDWVWTTPEIADGTLIAATGTGEVRHVSAPWLESQDVERVAVSVGGDRIAVVTRVDEVDVLSVAVIIRDITGAPSRIGAPQEIAPTLESVSDIGWLDQTSLTVLGAEPESVSDLLFIVAVEGPIEQRPYLTAAVSLTSQRSERSIMMANDEGTLFLRTGSTWRTIANNVQDPAYSG